MRRMLIIKKEFLHRARSIRPPHCAEKENAPTKNADFPAVFDIQLEFLAPLAGRGVGGSERTSPQSIGGTDVGAEERIERPNGAL
ncbi:hypothetical protein TNCV_766251 [Trichonephila clavipes]|nr:hypothetical protein TNCV_766251 [Trichonephila clavipes]